jgi:hypothetical protein
MVQDIKATTNASVKPRRELIWAGSISENNNAQGRCDARRDARLDRTGGVKYRPIRNDRMT